MTFIMDEGILVDTRPVRKLGNKWRVTLARPGVGTYGKYSEDMLRTRGPEVFPPGTKAFNGHENRSIRDLVGVYREGAFWNEEEGELQADLTPFSHWREILNELGPEAGASLHAAGTRGRDGSIELRYNRGNTVDLVGLPGLEGSGLKFAVESFQEDAALLGVDLDMIEDVTHTDVTRKEDKDMDFEKFAETITAAVTDLATTVNTFVSESRAASQVEVNEDAVQAAAQVIASEALATFAEKERLITEAQLYPSQAQVLKEAAIRGEDITEMLAQAKTFVEEAAASGASGGFTVGDDRTKVYDFTPKGWVR